MSIEESKNQIETLIEAWQLDEADLNQTDINAMQVLLKENQELKKQLEEKTKIGISDHKYASKCEDKVITMENQQKEFINYINAYIELLKDKPDLVEEGQKDILEEILSEYKKIIGNNE